MALIGSGVDVGTFESEKFNRGKPRRSISTNYKNIGSCKWRVHFPCQIQRLASGDVRGGKAQSHYGINSIRHPDNTLIVQPNVFRISSAGDNCGDAFADTESSFTQSICAKVNDRSDQIRSGNEREPLHIVPLSSTDHAILQSYGGAFNFDDDISGHHYSWNVFQLLKFQFLHISMFRNAYKCLVVWIDLLSLLIVCGCILSVEVPGGKRVSHRRFVTRDKTLGFCRGETR
mmetsp:Transcript_30841/g.62994  ORF Transcript_30841/g.62994 Transcript_30841/m.62994 type:complete len:231 (-) Transcript_30841:931-1623(-)